MLGSPNSRRSRCSPPARGWSQAARTVLDQELVLPARAGMVPPVACRGDSRPCAPRPRGDGPTPTPAELHATACSPPARGWSLRRPAHAGVPQVLPARAGVVPRSRWSAVRATSAPRPRGDGPVQRTSRSPRRCAPARAGMVPTSSGRLNLGQSAPRPRGMVPVWQGRLAQELGAPRARRDGPAYAYNEEATLPCSPRLRGWPRLVGHRLQLRRVFSAPAGLERNADVTGVGSLEDGRPVFTATSCPATRVLPVPAKVTRIGVRPG